MKDSKLLRKNIFIMLILLLLINILVAYILMIALQIVDEGILALMDIENLKISSISIEKLIPVLPFLFVANIFIFAFIYFKSNGKKYRKGKEHGSAEWKDKKDYKKISNKKFSDNKILSKDGLLDMHNARLNKNTLWLGSAGAGKTSNGIFPNILQAHSSFVITDPKGEIYKTTSKYLIDEGYKVKTFDLVQMSESNFYNPLKYIKDDTDVMKMVEVLIKNTNGDNKSSGNDPFWERAETALLQALLLFIINELPTEEHNLNTLMYYLDKLFKETQGDDEEFEGFVSDCFEKLEIQKPGCLAVTQWNIFNSAKGRTRESIQVSLGVRLGKLNDRKIKELLAYDSLDLDMVGDEKTAIYVIIPDTDSTFNFLASLMYTQLFQTLVYKADYSSKGLKYPVRCLLDEFANIGEIPEFDKLIATIRSRNISVDIIVQAMAQLKQRYKDTYETIIGNCDSIVFLGGTEASTLEFVEKRLGKETIDFRTTSGKSREMLKTNEQESNQITGRSLMFADELARIPIEDCVVMIRGQKPIYDKKYYYKTHPDAKKLVHGRFKSNEVIFVNKTYTVGPYTMDDEEYGNKYIVDDEGNEIESSNNLEIENMNYRELIEQVEKMKIERVEE